MVSNDPQSNRPGREQVDRMLDEIEKQAGTVRESWQAGEAARLRVLAGQLASLAEGTGNEAVGALAAELESMLVAEEAEASAMCERIEDLILQCKKAAGAKP
jgi:hypothetical protein